MSRSASLVLGFSSWKRKPKFSDYYPSLFKKFLKREGFPNPQNPSETPFHLSWGERMFFWLLQPEAERRKLPCFRYSQESLNSQKEKDFQFSMSLRFEP